MTGPALIFSRGGHRFALPLGDVRRVEAASTCQAVPMPAPGVLGMTLRGGQVFTLLSTPLPPVLPHPTARPRWVLVSGRAAFGFLVEGVEGVRETSPWPGEAPPPPEGCTRLGVVPVRADDGVAWLLAPEALEALPPPAPPREVHAP